MTCPHCAMELPENAAFCHACGNAIASPAKRAPRKRKGLYILAAVIAALLLLAAAAILLPHRWTPEESIAFSDDPAAISAASQSVVMLSCYDENDELSATGSGFAFFEDGVIVTNYHVIGEFTYRVEAKTEAGGSFTLTHILAWDEEKDIAILSTEQATNLPFLRQGSTQSLQKGEKVVAIGSPLGLMNSVSSGVFSGYTEENGMNTLQFTASISSGSSGGALFNDKGEVLGITFGSYEAGQNLNLAVPIEAVADLWKSRGNDTKQTLSAFYEAHIPTYTVDYVIANYDRLLGRTFYIEGWVFSHYTHLYEGSDLQWVGYCTLYNTVDDFPSAAPGTALYETEHSETYKNLCVIVSDSTLFVPPKVYEEMKTGDYIQLKVSTDEEKTDQYNIISLRDAESQVAD